MKLFIDSRYFDFRWWLNNCNQWYLKEFYRKKHYYLTRQERSDFYLLQYAGGEPYHFNRGEWE